MMAIVSGGITAVFWRCFGRGGAVSGSGAQKDGPKPIPLVFSWVFFSISSKSDCNDTAGSVGVSLSMVVLLCMQDGQSVGDPGLAEHVAHSLNVGGSDKGINGGSSVGNRASNPGYLSFRPWPK